jgi:hypothetical protein
MRRQKRDMNDRAFDRGYQAGVSGRSSDRQASVAVAAISVPTKVMTTGKTGYRGGGKAAVINGMA